jgi:tRNA modification GTPase
MHAAVVLNGATIAACATAAGRGGIGIIRLSGAQAAAIAMRLCGREQGFTPRQAHLCRWFDEHGGCLDEGLVLYFPAPASYTGEDVIELQGHGSPVLLQAILQRCYDLGCRPAQAGEFTRRAVANGCMDLSQAEGVIACIDAATERAARQAQRHLAGEFGRMVQQLMDVLLGITAHAEACLDFPEEEIPPLFLDQLRDQIRQQLLQAMTTMLRQADFGERLFNGATAVIVGAPNVGKSSLLNALSGRDRAIVSATAGTTRDVLEVDFAVHGIPVRLLDTAGLRHSDDAIEQEGVYRARSQADIADVTVFVADATRPDTWTVPEGISPQIYVMNKVDAVTSETDWDAHYLPLSVHQGQGLSQVVDAMAACLGDEPADDETPLITRSRHRAAVQRAEQALQAACELLDDEATMDLATLELRRAHSALAEIVGMGDVEDILDRVFSEFCIGK